MSTELQRLDAAVSAAMTAASQANARHRAAETAFNAVMKNSLELNEPALKAALKNFVELDEAADKAMDALDVALDKAAAQRSLDEAEDHRAFLAHVESLKQG